jgi:DNA-binding transcriptional LysR family regulator
METDPLAGVTVFVTAARARTFTQAAAQLGLTKSAVGKAVARLEERLGFKLFHRTTRVTTLTTDGEAYLVACTAAIAEIRASQSALGANPQRLSGRLHIDMPVAFGRRVLLPVLMEIARPHPDLGLTLTFTDATSDLLQDGVDLAIRVGALPDSGDLVARHLVTQQRIICAAPAYLSAYGTPQTLAEVHGHRCIVGTRQGPPLVWWINGGTTRMDEQRFTPPATHQLSDGEAMVTAAVGGLGLAQLPVSLVREQINDGRLVQVLPSCSGAGVEVHAVWPRQSHLNPRLRYVIDRLLDQAAQGRLD